MKMKTLSEITKITFSVMLLAVVASGCSIETNSTISTNGNGNGTSSEDGETTPAVDESSGDKRIIIDGSSTVYPISQAVAEEFQGDNPDVKVVVGTSGTGGGFKKFVVGETDVNDASRPIKEKEVAACKEANIEFIEIAVAIDGLSVVVNPENDWCNAMTTAQLKKLWEPGSKVTKWNELDPSWPEEEIKLFGPDTDSGTFDYFTEVICGEEGASRAEYTPSTDDNVLVKGVSGEKYALGYFGYAYYTENKAKLKAIGISATDKLEDAISPTTETIEGGTYSPLSRPLFIYVNTAKLEKPHLVDFLNYYLDKGQDLVGEVGYVRLGKETHEATVKTLKDAMAK